MRKFASILPILSGVLFGSVGIFIRQLSDAGFNSITIIFSRMSLAAVLLFIYFLFKDKSLLKLELKNLPYVLICGLCCMLGTNICVNISTNHLSLALAAVLLSIFPIYVMIASRIIFGEAITGKKVACAIAAIIGCILVSGVIGSGVSLSVAGVIAGLLSGVTYGAYGIVSKMALDKGVKSLTMTFYCLLAITIALAPFADYSTMGAFIAESPAKHFVFMVLHSVCIAVLTYICYSVALQYIEPGRASILASCESVAAMVFGVIFFSEIPDVLSILGLAITLVALTILARPEKQESLN